jgi:S1-C subfamily serine protease
MKPFFSRFSAGIFDLLLFALYITGWTKFPHLWLFWLFVIPLWIELCWQLKGSPGKVLFGIGIAFPSRGNVYLRELLGKSLTYAFCGFGLIPILFPQRRALHDYIANTDVDRLERAKRLVDAFRIAGAAVAALALAAVFYGSKSTTTPTTNAVASTSPASTTPQAPWKPSDAMPAVMTINVYQGNELSAQGSGFLVTSDGKGVTNVHVLTDCDRAEVELGDGRKFPITAILAYDPAQDVALFQIGHAATPFPKLTLGTGDDISVGDKIVVIGSPEGLNNTVSEGILSARRAGDPGEPGAPGSTPLLQLSAAISPGSSGGPVFDAAGQVVGVAQSQLEEGQNLNFAIPIEDVLPLLNAPAQNLTPRAFNVQLKNGPQRTTPPQESAQQQAPSAPQRSVPRQQEPTDAHPVGTIVH